MREGEVVGGMSPILVRAEGWEGRVFYPVSKLVWWLREEKGWGFPCWLRGGICPELRADPGRIVEG